MAYVETERTALLRSESLRRYHSLQDDSQIVLGEYKQKGKLSPSSPRFWTVIGAYSAIVFLNAANATSITTMYGAIAESLHAYGTAATWMTASYMIASSCANPLIGRLATIFRPTNLFLWCTCLFTFGCALCGLAQSESVFLLGRALSGVGAGGLFTTANVLLVEAGPVERRGLLIGVINAIATTGGSLGGVIAGAFAASNIGWRPAYLFQVPITAVSGVAILLFSPSPYAKEGKRPVLEKLAMVDYLGIATLCTSLVLLLSAAMASSVSAGTVALGICLLLLFILIEAKVAEYPIIPMELLLNPRTLLSCLSTLCTMSARWAVLFYAPIWASAVMGYHPAKSGAALIPTSIGFAAGGLLIGGFSVRHGGGYHWQCLISMLCFLSTYIIFIYLPFPADTSVYVGILIANGLTTGALLNFTLANTLSTTSEKAIAAALYNTFRGLAPTFGSGIAGGILQRTLGVTLFKSISDYRAEHGSHLLPEDLDLIRKLKGSPALVWQLKEEWQRNVGIIAYEQALRDVFWCTAVATVVGIVLQASMRLFKEQDDDVGSEEEEEEQRGRSRV